MIFLHLVLIKHPIKFATLINPRSICNKTLIIKDFVVEHDVDIMAITESWLHKSGDELIIR
jgi:hypothetical protein